LTDRPPGEAHLIGYGCGEAPQWDSSWLQLQLRDQLSDAPLATAGQIKDPPGDRLGHDVEH
jgi:hypothetical protein